MRVGSRMRRWVGSSSRGMGGTEGLRRSGRESRHRCGRRRRRSRYMDACSVYFDGDGTGGEVGTEDHVETTGDGFRWGRRGTGSRTGARGGAAREEEAGVDTRRPRQPWARGRGVRRRERVLQATEAGNHPASARHRTPNPREALPVVHEIRNLIDDHHVAVELVAEPLQLSREPEHLIRPFRHLVVAVLGTEERGDRVDHNQPNSGLLHENRKAIEQDIALPLQRLHCLDVDPRQQALRPGQPVFISGCISQMT